MIILMTKIMNYEIVKFIIYDLQYKNNFTINYIINNVFK